MKLTKEEVKMKNIAKTFGLFKMKKK